MAGITLAQAEARLADLLTAHEAICSGQAYSLNGRSLTRADLAAVEKSITMWERRVQRLQGGRSGIRVRGGTPTEG